MKVLFDTSVIIAALLPKHPNHVPCFAQLQAAESTNSPTQNELTPEAMATPIPILEEIKQMIFQLPIEEQVTLMEYVEEKLETIQMMQLAETGFTEWNDEEEDIYGV